MQSEGHTQHLQALQSGHGMDEVLFGQTKNLDVLGDIADNDLRFCGLLAYSRYLT